MTVKENDRISEEAKTCLQEKYKKNARRTRDTYNTQLTDAKIDSTSTGEKKAKKKITIEVDEDDPCLKPEEIKPPTPRNPGEDPRFQQQNQTLHCWVMYTDFYRCEHILGVGSSACTWFKQVFTTICPSSWIHRWDDLRRDGKFSWHKYKTQGDFPGHKYGV